MVVQAMAARQSKRSEGSQVLRHLVQSLRNDLNLISNEARKRHPAVREVSGDVAIMIGQAASNCRAAPLGYAHHQSKA